MITNPKIFTRDTVNYHFIWEWDVANVNIMEPFELYIYYYPLGTNESEICCNLNDPIIIQYYEPVAAYQIEEKCLSIEGFEMPLNSIYFKFKIKRPSESLDNAVLFPNNFYAIQPIITDCTLTPTQERNWFDVNFCGECQKNYEQTANKLAQYKVYYKKNLLGSEWEEAPAKAINGEEELVPNFQLRTSPQTGFDLNTSYQIMVGYSRENESADFPFTSFQNSITQTTITKGIEGTTSTGYEMPVHYTIDDIFETKGPGWDNSGYWYHISNIIDVTDQQFVYIKNPGHVAEYGVQLVAGNYNTETKEWTQGFIIDLKETGAEKTYNIENYNSLKFQVDTSVYGEYIPKPGTWAYGVGVFYYSIPVEVENDLNQITTIKTAQKLPHNEAAFSSLDNLTAIYYPVQYDTGGQIIRYPFYDCSYSKNNIYENDLYIYQQQSDGTYNLCNILPFDSSSVERSIMINDPDFPHYPPNPYYGYNIVTTDTPVTTPDGQGIISTGITQDQIDDITEGLNGLQYSLSLYELANLKTDDHPEGEFKENFIWEQMEIQYKDKYGVPYLYIKGKKQSNNSKILNNYYRVIVTNTIDFSCKQEFELGEYHDYFVLKKVKSDIYYPSGASLTELYNKELNIKSKYKIIIKAYSANKKRYKIIYENELTCCNKNFLQAPNYNFTPYGENYEELWTIEPSSSSQNIVVDSSCFNLLEFIDSNNKMKTKQLWEYHTAQVGYADLRQQYYDGYYWYPTQDIIFPVDTLLTKDIINTDKTAIVVAPGSREDKDLQAKFTAFDYYKNYSKKPNKVFGFSIIKNNGFDFKSGRPWISYDDTEDINNIAYFGYSSKAVTVNDELNTGLHNYDKTKAQSVSKVSIFPKNSVLTNTITNENILLTFKITEMLQKNCVTNIDNPKIVLDTHGIKEIDTWENNQRKIKFSTEEYEQSCVSIHFKRNVIVNSIQHLKAKCDKLEIKDEKGNVYYSDTDISESTIKLNNQKIKCKTLYFYITNGYISSDGLKISLLEQAKGDSIVTEEGRTILRGLRNRKIKTDNIILYLNSGSYIDYENFIANGEEITGLVKDNNKPVNFYIEDFLDLQDDNKGDLIYKIEKIKEEVLIQDILSNDDNIVNFTQKNKNNKIFTKSFNINSYTHKLKIQNTKTKKIQFLKHQKDTLVNCVLDKEEQ